jgi:hypothetical protein
VNEIGSLADGQRNDGLIRTGGYLRRKGWEYPAIEAELLHQNLRRCRPPLDPDEVRTIAASAARYPAGGPDPLEQAWQAVQRETHKSSYEEFVALARQLKRSRPEHPVALPQKRIAALMECDWTSVRGYCKDAVMAGFIRKVADPIPHRRAAQYEVFIPSMAETATAPTQSAPTIPTISHYGLVGISTTYKNRHSGNSAHSGNEPEGENWEQVVRLARRGFRLFPCRPENKIPAIKAWPEKATCDLEQLTKWFQEFAGCNWACATGEASGVWVLDDDSDAAGAAMMRRFQEHGYIGPETLCVKTGRSFGYHLYFSYPKGGGARIASKTGIKGWHEDLDIRAEGGYVMVPPSIWTDDPKKAKAEGREIRPSQPYTFLQGDGCPIAEAPEWLIEAITEKKRNPWETPRFAVLDPDEALKAAKA